MSGPDAGLENDVPLGIGLEKKAHLLGQHSFTVEGQVNFQLSPKGVYFL